MKKILFPVIVLFAISSCASMQSGMKSIESVKDAILDSITLKKQIPSQESLLPFDSIQAQTGYMYFPLRADLIRQEKKADDTNKPLGRGSDNSRYVPYAVTGLRLGNGLFIDSNRNLSLDFAELTGFSTMENCTLTIKDNSIMGDTTVIVKKGAIATVTKGTLFPKTFTVTAQEQGAIIDNGIFSFTETITVNDDAVVFNPGGPLGFIQKEKIERKGKSFSVPGLLGDTAFAHADEDGSLKIDASISSGQIIIRNDETKLSIRSSQGLKSRDCSLVRSKDRIVFYDNIFYTGFMIDIRDNEFIYTGIGSNDEKTLTLKITKN